jgi:hypothetical protein
VTPLFDVRRCVVCRCTDEHGCAEGCEWICLAPPVCSCCVAKFVLARLWSSLFSLEGKAKGADARDVEQMRTFYSSFRANEAERFGIPTLREVCQINRTVAKWMKQNPPARKKATTTKGGRS